MGGISQSLERFLVVIIGVGLSLAPTELGEGCANHPTMYKMAPTSKDYLAPNGNSAKVDSCSFSSQFGTTASRKAFLNPPDRVRYLFLGVSIVLYCHTLLNDKDKLLGNFVIGGHHGVHFHKPGWNSLLHTRAVR